MLITPAVLDMKEIYRELYWMDQDPMPAIVVVADPLEPEGFINLSSADGQHSLIYVEQGRSEEVLQKLMQADNQFGKEELLMNDPFYSEVDLYNVYSVASFLADMLDIPCPQIFVENTFVMTKALQKYAGDGIVVLEDRNEPEIYRDLAVALRSIWQEKNEVLPEAYRREFLQDQAIRDICGKRDRDDMEDLLREVDAQAWAQAFMFELFRAFHIFEDPDMEVMVRAYGKNISFENERMQEIRELLWGVF